MSSSGSSKAVTTWPTWAVSPAAWARSTAVRRATATALRSTSVSCRSIAVLITASSSICCPATPSLVRPEIRGSRILILTPPPPVRSVTGVYPSARATAEYSPSGARPSVYS